jgi:hypothetical protein
VFHFDAQSKQTAIITLHIIMSVQLLKRPTKSLVTFSSFPCFER